MSDLSLYKSCLRKIAVHLRAYKSCHQNPFSVLPSKIVNDVMSAALDLQGAHGLRAEDLEQLLTSGKLRELKISVMGVNIDQFQNISHVLCFLKSGCQKLEIFHLTVFAESQAWERSEVSVARTRSEVVLANLRSEVSTALGDLLISSPNLKDLHCFISFDLEALRNCRELRRLSLHFEPQQHWHDFLAKEKDHFQTHECLEFFTICEIFGCEQIPYDDIVIILRHCPALTSLGFIESSEALSRLHRMGISPSELNLRHCYWREGNQGIHQVREAVLHCPMIEELDFYVSCLRSISCLRNLRNLVSLDLTSNGNTSDVAFKDELQVFGPQLKHLSVCTNSRTEISLLLQNCHNLESFKIYGDDYFDLGEENFNDFSHPAVSLPNLQRLTLSHTDSFRRVFSLLSDCNQLTELFLIEHSSFDEHTFINFLRRNSLLNLKLAYLECWDLTEHGFREFLLSAPQLEIVEARNIDFNQSHFKRVVRETNPRALCNEGLLSEMDEFFKKKLAFYSCGLSRFI